MKVIPQIHSGGGPTLESGGRAKDKNALVSLLFCFCFFPYPRSRQHRNSPSPDCVEGLGRQVTWEDGIDDRKKRQEDKEKDAWDLALSDPYVAKTFNQLESFQLLIASQSSPYPRGKTSTNYTTDYLS